MSDALYQTLGLPWSVTSQGSFTNATIDASGKKIAFVFPAESAETLTTALIRYGLRTGTPPVYKVSLQSVSTTTGEPSGVLTGNSAGNVEVTFTPPASTAWDGTIRRLTFGDTYTPTRGQMLALVIEYSSGTIDASNNSSFSVTINCAPTTLRPYSLTNSGAAWTKSTTNPVFGVAGALKAYGFPLLNTSTLTIGTTEVGFRFTPDAAWGDTYKAIGLRQLMRLATASSVARVNLYDTNGTTVLQTVDVDSDQVSGTGGQMIDIVFAASTLATLQFGNSYYIGVQTLSGSNVSIYFGTVDAANDWTAFTGGTLFPYCSRATPGAGAWTVTSTQRLFGGLLLDDITEPSSGGIVRNSRQIPRFRGRM